MLSELKFSSGNQVEVLNTAENAYAAMVDAVKAARSTIWLANFHMKPGRAFDLFTQPLLDAARRGVSVKLLFDNHGSASPERELHSQLAAAGIEVVWFRPFRVINPLSYNQRMHKKLLIIDGETGFTGGVGIGDFWVDHHEYPKVWRDTHFKLSGPILRDMAASFKVSWDEYAHDPLVEPWFFASEENGASLATIGSNAKLFRKTVIHELFLSLFDSAKQRIDITTAYFAPDKALRSSLIRAAKRGVKVRIITNGPFGTNKTALEAGKSLYSSLTKNGISIYEYQPTKIHAKIFLVDNDISCIGSANLNFRSTRHDQEFNIVAKDRGLTDRLTQDFEADLKNCLRVSRKTNLKQRLFSLGRYFF